MEPTISHLSCCGRPLINPAVELLTRLCVHIFTIPPVLLCLWVYLWEVFEAPRMIAPVILIQENWQVCQYLRPWE
eukprot:2426372-Karenia_brevis.AAC.1